METEPVETVKPVRLPGIGLLALLLASSGLAFVWPFLGIAHDPFRLGSTSLLGLVAVTMFCLGTAVRTHELSELRRRPMAVFLGVLLQCTWMPMLAWTAIRLLGLDGPLAYGVLLAGCVPGAMASNVLTMAAKGNVSYSVSLTTVATLLSPLTVPMALAVFAGLDAEATALNPKRTAITLVLTVVIPVVVGFVVRQGFHQAFRWIDRIAPSVASIALLWIIASVVAGNRDRLTQVQPMMLMALLMLNLLGYLGGWCLGRLARMPQSMGRALTLEIGMQNAGLGTALAATLLGENSIAQIPTAAYTFGCMLTGTILAAVWSRSVEDTPVEQAEMSSS